MAPAKHRINIEARENRQKALAALLAAFAYGYEGEPGTVEEFLAGDDEDFIANYMADAFEVLDNMPHLLPLDARGDL